jgi:putative ABC transport system substrate-binding protein
MRRREFITLIGGAAVAWPLAARAQQRRVIGFLSSSSPESFAPFTAAFRHGLERAGYVEGKDVAIEFRWAQGKYDRLAELAVELVRRNVDVIVTHGTPATYAAMQATTATPIVMAISGDAVATGITTSLARPDANVTGSTFFLPKLNAKRLELFKEAFPRIVRVAALSNPDNPVSRPIIPPTTSSPRSARKNSPKPVG